MSNFDFAVEALLSMEGGYVNHPKDPGGETNFGISKRSYPNLDIRNLTKEEAVAIYKKDFWDRYGYGKVNDVFVATKLLDMCVNFGPHRAHMLVQRACSNLGKDIKTDGYIGPRTLQAINETDSRALTEELVRLQVNLYDALIEANSNLNVFRHGWNNRATHILRLMENTSNIV